MSYYEREALSGANLGSLTLTGANETLKYAAPQGISFPLLQQKKVSFKSYAAEIWVPVGIWYTVTTGITVTNAQVILRKNGVSALTPAGLAGGGIATLPIVALSVNMIFAPFTPWTFAAPDALGDVWSVLVTVTATAGVVNPIMLAYQVRSVAALNEGVAG